MSSVMFYKYSTVIIATAYSLVLFFNTVISAQENPTIPLGLITNTSSNTNWTKIFHDALRLNDKLSQKVKFEFIAVSKTDLNSFGKILDTLCHELLPRKVQAVFLATEGLTVYKFTKMLAVVPLLSLGTNRDSAMENQVSCMHLETNINQCPPVTGV